jgi:hypothetical protein
VIATLPVAGLSGRKPEKSRDETQREIVQQSSVEQQVVSLPALPAGSNNIGDVDGFPVIKNASSLLAEPIV